MVISAIVAESVMTRAEQAKQISQLTVAQFEATFPNEDACKAYLVARRWPDGVHCPRCGNTKVYDLKSRKWHWQCEQCDPNGYRFSVSAGTVFENTNKPLRDWYRLIHLLLTGENVMSTRELHRRMGFGSYKTAWYMAHRVRAALIVEPAKLAGIVEADEAPIAKLKSKRRRKRRTGYDALLELLALARVSKTHA
jgi:transposase-like protein